MSTNRTENYQLHVWGAEDEESLAEINENFAKLDQIVQGKTGIVVGSYIGDGADLRHIELGRKPLAVLVELSDGIRQNMNNSIHGGLALQGIPLASSAVMLDDTGFTLSTTNRYSMTNTTGQTRVYLAAVEDE